MTPSCPRPSFQTRPSGRAWSTGVAGRAAKFSARRAFDRAVHSSRATPTPYAVNAWASIPVAAK